MLSDTHDHHHHEHGLGETAVSPLSYTHPSPHDHDHDHHHHDHDHDHSLWERVASALHIPGYSHEHASPTAEQTFFDNNLGIRTVWLALVILFITTLLQIGVVILSQSVALLGDTVHNLGDSLNSIPLLFAFYLARRAATRRYNYGYTRAEDVAGILIVFSIAFSAFFIFKESIERFLNPQPLTHLGWLAVAAVIGFLGNEAVALIQIRVGKQISSAAMIADGLHARTDGLTSLAVLLAAGGAALGYPIFDPIIGLFIGVVILFITWDASKKVWYRLMDAVEPEYVDNAEKTLQRHKMVRQVHRVRLRWMGHRLHAEVQIGLDAHLTTAESHHIAEELRHDLFHTLPNLSEAMVHVEPWLPLEQSHHLTIHHEPTPQMMKG